jgi:hypothetical protein
LWAASPAVSMRPAQVYDTANNPAFDSGGHLLTTFNGEAARIVYAGALPTASNIGAYFIGFVGRVYVQVQDTDSGVYSNPILLQLEPPPISLAPIVGYLYPTPGPMQQGRLNANRLGGVPLPTVPFYSI